MNIELSQMDALELMRGLMELTKKRESAMKRARKRGFRDHEIAEFSMAISSSEELTKRLYTAYKEKWPE